MTTDSFSWQTTANVEQIRDIQEMVQSLAETLASTMGDQDDGEKVWREGLREFVLPHREALAHH